MQYSVYLPTAKYRYVWIFHIKKESRRAFFIQSIKVSRREKMKFFLAIAALFLASLCFAETTSYKGFKLVRISIKNNELIEKLQSFELNDPEVIFYQKHTWWWDYGDLIGYDPIWIWSDFSINPMISILIGIPKSIPSSCMTRSNGKVY